MDVGVSSSRSSSSSRRVVVVLVVQRWLSFLGWRRERSCYGLH